MLTVDSSVSVCVGLRFENMNSLEQKSHPEMALIGTGNYYAEDHLGTVQCRGGSQSDGWVVVTYDI